MATYGREKEVGEFLSKLKVNDYPKEKIEVIIVDQNDKINLKPIITTDENGVYYTVTKVRGRKQSLSKMTELLKGYLEKCKCEVAVLHAGCEEEAIKYMEAIKNLPNISSIKIAEISPALGVHSGPGLFGFSVKMDK